MRRAFRFIWRFLFIGLVIPLYYNFCTIWPVEKHKAVFISYRGDMPPSSYNMVKKELEKRGYSCTFRLLRKNTVGSMRYLLLCLSMISDIATARYVFVSSGSNILSRTTLREESTMVQLWHACGAFKKFGFSTADNYFGGDEAELIKWPNYKNDDLAFVSSPEVVWAYEEAFGVGKTSHCKVLPLGVSRTDVFFDEKAKESALSWMYELCPEAKGKKILLYAPTYRGNASKPMPPNMLDARKLEDELAGEWHLVIKQHPFIKKPPGLYGASASFATDITGKIEMDEALMCADCLITDYSSVIFEFSLLEKPMIFYAYDIEDFTDWRGFYYSFNDFAPGNIVNTESGIIDSVNDAKNFDRQKVIEFREKFMVSCDGHSTERCVSYLIDKSAVEFDQN